MGKNLGFIIPGLKNGGAERVLSTVSLNLDKSIKQYIFAWNGMERDYEFQSDIVDLGIKNEDNIIKNIFVLLKRVRAMRKYKKQYKLDVCISHLEGANIVNILSKGKEKTVVTVHNFQSKEREGAYGIIFKLLIKLLYNRADKVITVSELIKLDLINNFGINKNKIEVIYNPFDCNLIEELSKEEIEKELQPLFKNDVIINVGRLTEQKGQWHLIKAFSELKKQNKNVKLAMLGQGELREDLEELVRQLNLEQDVIFLGFRKNPFKYIAKAKVFALTSLFEGFPMCIAEAMACGVPVVSVDCKSGPREMLSRERDLEKVISDIEISDFGILSPSFDNEVDFTGNININEKIYTKALTEMLVSSEVRKNYSKVARNQVRELDVNKIIVKWNKLIID